MKRIWIILASVGSLAGCGNGLADLGFGRDRDISAPEVSVTEAPGEDVMRPRARQGGAAQTGTAAPQAGPDGFLGETLAGLGAPTEPGLWIMTGLVAELRHGRVETATDDSVSLELRPSGGEAGAGSQLSLAAMQALGVPLTELATVRVYVDL